MEINSAGETKKKNPKQINHDLNVHTKSFDASQTPGNYQVNQDET